MALNLNGDRLMRLPIEDSKANYLAGFWKWVELMAADDYQGGTGGPVLADGDHVHAGQAQGAGHHLLRWRGPVVGGGAERAAVAVINDAADFQPRNPEGWGWFMAQVPVTTEPADPKNDEIPLMGLASSFFVKQLAGRYVLEFEIFHL